MLLCIALVPGNREDQTVKTIHIKMYKLFLEHKSYYISFFPISYKPGFIMGILTVMFSLIKKLKSIFSVFFMFFEYIKECTVNLM